MLTHCIMITFQNLTTFAFIFFWNNSFLPFSYFSDFMSKLAYGNCHLRSLGNRIINLRFDKTTNCSFRHVIILAICILSCNSKCSVQQIYVPFVCNKNFRKFHATKMFPAISQQKSRYCNNRILFPEHHSIDEYPDEWRHNFLTNQRAAFCSRAPHCLLSISPTYS